MKRLSVLALLIVAVYYLAGCGGGGGSGNSAQAITTASKSSLDRETNPRVTDAELASVAAGNTAFALKLFPLLDSNPDNNTFFSPYSITQAFAMLAPGARGTTLSQIEQALSFPLTQDRLNPAFNKLDLLLAAKATGTVLTDGRETPQLKMANAVWGQQGFTFLTTYLDALALNFGAGLHLADFANATEASRQTINSWVEDQTNNRIKDLIPQGGVTPSTRMVLTNAIWFKASWASQFSKSSTRNLSFTNRNGSSSSIPFMRKQLYLPYARTAGCQAVDIPYAGDNLSMLVIMPDAGTFDSFVSSLTPAVLAAITSLLSSTYLDFSMPKFSFTRSSALKSALQPLGMAAPFDSTLADLSGIDGRRDLFVQAVFHQAFIDVNEEGTEAAAATSISYSSLGGPSLYVALSIDHPFIFLIRDRQTGLVLFMGKVVTLPA